MIQVGLQGSFSVVFWVGWLIVYEFLNSFHSWDFKFLQWYSYIGARCFKTVWWSPNIRHQSPSELVSISQETRPHLSVFLTSHVLSMSCALTCLHRTQSSLVSALWWNIYWQNMEFSRTFTSLISLTSQTYMYILSSEINTCGCGSTYLLFFITAAQWPHFRVWKRSCFKGLC